MRKIWVGFLVILLSMSLMACGQPQEQTSAAPVPINPVPEAVSKDKSTAKLYFGYADKPLLLSESRAFDVPVNENVETSVVKELIKGPSASRMDFTPIINPATKVVGMSLLPGDGNIVGVTLSKEFLLPVEEKNGEERLNRASEQTRRMLAVYSIVNTLVEQGLYARVQILIDDDNTGTGRPITLQESGLDSNAVAEPFARDGSIILNGANTVREILAAIENKDYSTLYSYIAYKNAYGQDKPSMEDFVAEINNRKLSLSDAKVLDSALGADGTTDIVMVDAVLSFKDDQTYVMNNVPLRMFLENGIWKMSYNVFSKNFLS